jgi:hypothetical protein
LTVWYALKNRITNELVSLHHQVQSEMKSRAKSTQEIGPTYSIDSIEKTLQDSVNFWKKSSLQMRDVLKPKNIRYFHFLQPNQYFKGSKPLSVWEKQYAVSTKSEAAESIQLGYPLLIKAGGELKEAGVQFMDLTGIFKNETDTLYKDFCCHYNQIGNEILAREIGENIKSSFSARK